MSIHFCTYVSSMNYHPNHEIIETDFSRFRQMLRLREARWAPTGRRLGRFLRSLRRRHRVCMHSSGTISSLYTRCILQWTRVCCRRNSTYTLIYHFQKLRSRKPCLCVHNKRQDFFRDRPIEFVEYLNVIQTFCGIHLGVSQRRFWSRLRPWYRSMTLGKLRRFFYWSRLSMTWRIGLWHVCSRLCPL